MSQITTKFTTLHLSSQLQWNSLFDFITIMTHSSGNQGPTGARDIGDTLGRTRWHAGEDVGDPLDGHRWPTGVIHWSEHPWPTAVDVSDPLEWTSVTNWSGRRWPTEVDVVSVHLLVIDISLVVLMTTVLWEMVYLILKPSIYCCVVLFPLNDFNAHIPKHSGIQCRF